MIQFIIEHLGEFVTAIIAWRGDKVIWGGYSWTNVNGNIGASVDVLNLDAEWTKNVYDTTNYNIAYDVIEYDYTNDMIIRRFEKESNVDVSFRTKTKVVPNLSTATYIYDGNIKEVYQRPDNALKIRYYDNSDVLQIVDIDD